MKRTECGGCSSPNLIPVLDLGETALADQFPATLEESAKQKKYPLKLVVCDLCNLFQLEEIVSNDILFGADYGFYSGTSQAILKYYDTYALWLWNRFPEQDLEILEIACNDGGLLQSMKNTGFERISGVDPASGPAKVAADRGFDVDVSSFTQAWGRDHQNTYDVVIANHVVAHTADLGDFLRGIEACLKPRGCAVIEFQYLPDLLVGNMIDHVYHEHRFFFSVSSFGTAAIRQAGLNVVSAEWIDRQGGSMRVVLMKENPHPRDLNLAYDERWLNSWDTYESLQGRADHIKDRLLNLINPSRGILAGYGAPAKATTLLNFCGLTKREIKWVIDTTPSKIGKFMPGTDIPIISPDAEELGMPHQYLLLVWNYVSEVIRKESRFIENGGRFIVPIPYPTVI